MRDIQVEVVDQLQGDVAQRSSRRTQGRRARRRKPAAERMAADHHIVEHRHGAEQREVLEGAADADLGDAVRRQARMLALEQDVAAVGV